MFLRTKKVRGYEYVYLVRSEYRSGKVKQKVIKYLGKANLPEKDNGLLFKDFIAEDFSEYIKRVTYKDFVADVSRWLVNRYSFDERKIYKLNEGYFCNFTIKKLMSFDPSKHEDPEREFAKTYLNAGFPRDEKDIFIALFLKLK